MCAAALASISPVHCSASGLHSLWGSHEMVRGPWGSGSWVPISTSMASLSSEVLCDSQAAASRKHRCSVWVCADPSAPRWAGTSCMCVCGRVGQGRCHVAEPNWIEEIKWSFVGHVFLQRTDWCHDAHLGCGTDAAVSAAVSHFPGGHCWAYYGAGNPAHQPELSQLGRAALCCYWYICTERSALSCFSSSVCMARPVSAVWWFAAYHTCTESQWLTDQASVSCGFLQSTYQCSVSVHWKRSFHLTGQL